LFGRYRHRRQTAEWGASPRPVTDVTAKKDLIVAGMGWGGLPEHVVAPELADGTLRALSVPGFTEAMDLFTMRRRDRPHGVVATALWEALARAGTPPPPRPRRRAERASHPTRGRPSTRHGK